MPVSPGTWKVPGAPVVSKPKQLDGEPVLGAQIHEALWGGFRIQSSESGVKGSRVEV